MCVCVCVCVCMYLCVCVLLVVYNIFMRMKKLLGFIVTQKSMPNRKRKSCLIECSDWLTRQE